LSGNPSTDWYRTFFTELPNEFWRGAVPAEATEAEVDFVERHLDLKPGSSVVDVPCGSGRHTLALAGRGHLVTGVDISSEAIGYARRAAADAGLDVELSIGEMRDIPRDGRFDAAICMGNSFGYFDLADTQAIIAALAGALRPGGGLVIDYGAVAESLLPGFTGGEDTMSAGGVDVLASREYDAVTSRLVTTYEFSRGTERVRVSAPYYLYTNAHLTQLFTEAGFTDLERFGTVDDQPFALGHRRMLLVARRAEA
jgi:SAM-dependent methyltransferase